MTAAVLDPARLPPAQRERRRRIVAAAIDLLSASEYDTVQMRDVAERAGVALATIYRYFTSKEHLYAAALVEWSAGYPSRVGGGRPRGDTPEERLRALMHRAVRAFERYPQMMRAEMTLEMSNDPNARALFEQFASQNKGVLLEGLEGLDPHRAAAIIDVVNAVLATRLRSWALARCSIRDVDRSVQAAIDVLFTRERV